MRILQINSVCGVGSTGRITTDIHSILKEQGHESYVAYGRNNPMNCESAIRIGNKFDNYSHVAKTRILDKHGFGSRRATKNFIEKIKFLDPDVIHLHNIHGYYINIKILFDYLKEINKPVVWTLHDCWAFTGHCTHFEYVGCECWKVDGNHICSQKREYPASLFINNSKKNYKKKKEAFTGVKNLTIVTPSNWLKNIVKASFLKEYPVKLINNGIDIDVFKPSKGTFRSRYGLENKFILLGAASTWSEKKGYNFFLELSYNLEQDEKIVLIGLSENQKQNLPNNILGITRTNDIKELAEIYSSADVFVNPTLEEVLGLTNLEALACGTPVITFETGGSIECIDDSCGIVVEKGNMYKTLEAIKIIKTKYKSFYSMSCIDRVNKLFSKEDKYSEYVELYENCR
ncbi:MULTISPECIES: glycosyltransferase [Paraliobacillus]|uniref:glycosyltransferase n=1 Tax=Paraliobacillus TaxID=200903 RepID=UPI000DD4E6C1|nr:MULTISPECIES: glycosyltransferase [Paraliobacillus]